MWASSRLEVVYNTQLAVQSFDSFRAVVLSELPELQFGAC